MFNKDFYPTPEGVIAHMLDGINLKGKKVLEPSAGKGNIVDYLKRSGADVIACELNPDLREDINKFVEKQTHIPFTMRNVYHMLNIVIGTTAQRMDRALLEAFDKLTMHYDENRYNVEGWKTNSHYLMNKRFILPYLSEPSFRGGVDIKSYNSNVERVNDLAKALCFLTGVNYDTIGDINGRSLTPNTWYEWGFFRYKVFKNGTGHFEFKDIKVWEQLNRRIAELKGYPLFEAKKAKNTAEASF